MCFALLVSISYYLSTCLAVKWQIPRCYTKIFCLFENTSLSKCMLCKVSVPPCPTVAATTNNRSYPFLFGLGWPWDSSQCNTPDACVSVNYVLGIQPLFIPGLRSKPFPSGASGLQQHPCLHLPFSIGKIFPLVKLSTTNVKIIHLTQSIHLQRKKWKQKH